VGVYSFWYMESQRWLDFSPYTLFWGIYFLKHRKTSPKNIAGNGKTTYYLWWSTRINPASLGS
jgi:hypothetical protein